MNGVLARFSRVAALAALAALAIGVVPASGALAASNNTSAFDSIGACFSAHKHLLLAVVLDESASLGDAATHRPGTDPTGRRVDAAEVALDGIAELAQSGTRVDVELSGFSDALHVYGPWQQLTAATRSGIRGQLEAFRARNQGLDTDFYTAVDGVQHELARQAATVQGASPCEVVLLFTDGRFDIDTRVAKPYDANSSDPKDVKAALGINALCAPNGPMQRLRDDGVHTITLALDDNAATGSGPDRGFLERLASGPCSSAGTQYGASFDATNAAGLVAEFDAIATRLRGATKLGSDCGRLDVVPAIGAVHVFADTGSPSSDLIIAPPHGAPLTVSAAHPVAPAVRGVSLRVTATSGRYLTIDVAPTGAAPWLGRWSMSFARAAPGATCHVSAFAAWTPKLQATTVVRGSSTTLVFGVVDRDGKPVSRTALADRPRLVVDVAAVGAASPSQSLVARPVGDHFEAKYTAPAGFGAPAVTVTATLHLEAGRTDLASAPNVTELPVRALSGFPSVSPTLLQMPSITGRGSSAGLLQIHGDARDAGTVCIESVGYPTTPPIPPDQIDTTDPNTCVRVGPGGSASLAFTLHVGTKGDGRMNGLVHLALSGRNGQHSATTVAFTVTLTHGVSTTTRNGLFALLLVLAIVFPLALLLLLARHAARFEVAAGLRAAQVSVRVYADGTLRRVVSPDETATLDLNENDFFDAGIPPGTMRWFRWRELTLAGAWSWNPFAAPYGEVRQAGQYVTASDGVLRGRRVTKGRISLALPGTWVFVVDRESREEGTVDGVLTAFIAPGAPFEQQAPRVMKTLQAFFDDVARRIEASHDSSPQRDRRSAPERASTR